ncbi:snRNA-activating protein complex subunit 2 [Salvelinus sp. IW2-2015]|uniref:snRNA-activating protein complex subunit 2 n=1 Tax=Salvelinus sp. IW2-2015 TaxID=2691554 RepID=UPI000CDFA7DF|nr:snRNA-activating protein complex subunit 2 [Salvelinus alpinus]
MKPPSRSRIQPTRYVNKKTEKTVSKRKSTFACAGWSRTEQQVLLRCLNKQNKMTGGIHGAIDIEALHEKLPKQSKEEIQSQLESLMMRVLRAVVGQVKRQRSELKAALKPIQLWAELAHDMAGALEEPITSAFAQMLVISATEPGSLTNSDPPREDYLPKQQRSNFKTIPPRPIPTSISPKNPAPSGVSNSPIVFNIASTPQPPPAVSVPVSGVPTTQPSTMNPGSGASKQKGRTTTPASTVGALPQAGCSNSSILSQNQEGSAISTLLTVPMPVQSLSASSSGPTTSLQSQAVPQGGAHGQTMSNVLSTQLPVMSSPAPADVSKQQQPSAAASSIRPQPQHPGAGPRKSKHADENTPRYTGLGSIVDFEKIYRFLSMVHVQSECFRLTPMESAIILDLLMSLPEELPLLDCARLQHHLLQVHERFSAPVPNVSREGTGTGRPWSSAGGEGTKAGDQRKQDGGAILVAVTTPPNLDAGDKVGAPLQIQQESQVEVGRGGAISGIPDGRGSDGMECTSTNQGVAATVVPVNLVAGCSNSVAKDGAVPLQESTEERAGTETFAPSQDNGQAQGQTPSTNDASAKSGTATQRKPDWEKAGLCPLNPFMVPLKLLARQQIQSVEEVVLE